MLLFPLFLLTLTGQATAEYRSLALTSLCREFSSSWAGVYSLSVISITSPQEAIIVILDQAELTAPLSCDLHIRSSRAGQSESGNEIFSFLSCILLSRSGIFPGFSGDWNPPNGRRRSVWELSDGGVPRGSNLPSVWPGWISSQHGVCWTK